ncbi:hypothetical protein PQ455_05720 [Sphingomonas naphthae]|uniref:Lipoprotein n=1 Tax=Sphingomonas naphthae TaxID=1813468 RepID=A0ABY7TS80_9SPHN|nr:hypothetical protein [Sphingomonas naphthae]WCT74724.1 hypothetical protein PQ455_05720 [Sphingomonas naphthae]
MTMRIAFLLPPLALLGACGSPAPAPTPAAADNAADVAPAAADDAEEPAPAAASAPVPVAAPAAAKVDLLGKWIGVEGLYFQVSPGSDDNHYKVLNSWTLDDEASFVATREGNTLSFVREGVTEHARLGTGAETGFKWLDGKKDCLIVKVEEEGYCRD